MKPKKRKPNPEAVARRRATQAAARRAQTRQGQDIGKLPPCKNPKRRAACKDDFGRFCKTYFPEIFCLEWSKDLLRVIAKVERVVLDHHKLAVAMPRGSGKTSLSETAILWAILYGRHRFAVLVAAVAPKAEDSMISLKSALLKNDLLLEDFPEVCYPIRKIDGEARRCLGQLHQGKRTNVKWGSDRIVLPTIEGSPASGAIIDATSIEGNIRGSKFPMPDGSTARPTLAMVDDCQTPESARSQGPSGQTTYRLQVIKQDVQGLAGPNRKTAILVPCTVICPGDLADQLLNRKLYPDFRGERTKRLYAWPTNRALWEQYRELREAAMRTDQPVDESMAFYRERMCKFGRRLDEPGNCPNCPHKDQCMDCGAIVDWVDRIDADSHDISSLQTAMHSYYEYGEAGFAAEFQNEPLANEAAGQRWTQDLIASRFTGRPRYEVPIDATEITVGVDVQQWSLWYTAVAWSPNFTGHIIDYGVWPEQNRRVITKAEIEASHVNMQTRYPGRGTEGSIQAGLEEFVAWMLGRNFPRGGGAGLMRVSRMLVDAGKWPGLVAAAKMKVGGQVMVLSKGVGISARNPPMSTRKAKKGEGKRDPFGHWYMPAVQGTKEFPHVAIDVNFWKSFAEQGFLTAPGDPGALTLFGDGPQQHSLFAAHLDAETWTETEGHGRKLHEWTIRPGKPDNEFLDTLVYASVGASYQGCARSGSHPPISGVVRRKRVNIDELLSRRQGIEP